MRHQIQSGQTLVLNRVVFHVSKDGYCESWRIIVKEIDKLPFDVVMRLYHYKVSAETKGDIQALMKLEQQYPDLFSREFDEFISNMRMSIEYLRHKYDEDFREILTPKKLIQH